ncbi:hypothetical protein MRX96_040700 [Rhipicephalus microplus]
MTKTNQRQQLGAERFSKFSSWSSLTRAVGGIIRVARRAKSSPPEEMDLVDLPYRAKVIIIHSVQQDVFSEELRCIQKGEQVHKTSSLQKLNPFLDAQGLIHERQNWQVRKKDIKEGDVVLIRDEEANRSDWPIGVVTQSLPSADGMVRRVEVKIARNGAIRKLCQPISEVVPLFSPSTNCGV